MLKIKSLPATPYKLLYKLLYKPLFQTPTKKPPKGGFKQLATRDDIRNRQVAFELPPTKFCRGTFENAFDGSAI